MELQEIDSPPLKENEQLAVEVPEADYSKVDTVEHMIEYFSRALEY